MFWLDAGIHAREWIGPAVLSSFTQVRVRALRGLTEAPPVSDQAEEASPSEVLRLVHSPHSKPRRLRGDLGGGQVSVRQTD